MTKIELSALDSERIGFPYYNRFMNLESHHIELIGYCAAFLTTIAFLPQAIQSWRTRDVSGVSLLMYSLFTAGVVLWLIYGLIIDKWPIILANTLTLTLALSILLLKLRHTSHHRK
jgi:MtN3 and saliva related transmembrane protein